MYLHDIKTKTKEKSFIFSPTT